MGTNDLADTGTILLDDTGMALWSCQVGEAARRHLPMGCDYPMRRAVAAVYKEITGYEPDFIFSGWGDPLPESRRAVVENRLPVDDAVLAEALAEIQHILDFHNLVVVPRSEVRDETQGSFDE